MLKGIGASGGIGIGRIVLIKETDIIFEDRYVTDTASELERFHKTSELFIQKTNVLAEKAKKSLGENESKILKGHAEMMKDPFLKGEVEKLILSGRCCESAVDRVCEMIISMFSAADNELIAQRAADIGDMKKRILKLLLNIDDIDISNIPKGSIICVSDLTPSMTVNINKDNVAGFITETGGTASHAAILSRALEIPAVLSITDITHHVKNGDTAVIDGNRGEVLISPSESQIKEFEIKREQYISKKEELKKFIGKPTKTSDGIKADLFCNIGNQDDADKVSEFDGEGIGLFRTEFLFMGRSSAPSEEEQLQAYKAAAIKMRGKPVIIRTLDVGGDKNISYIKMPAEDNPFLGFRAVRYCLENKKLYSVQLRAILRASVFGNIKIMIPMVSCIEEIRDVKNLLNDIKTQLRADGISFDENIPVGIMVETPSAVISADLFAKEADFFSIGTNDLIQYTMVADRGNPKVSYLYSVFNPSVIRSIKKVIDCAKSYGISVGMCGEAAADKLMIPLLISFGLDEFSVSASSVLEVRKQISLWSKDSADKVTEEVLKFSTAGEIISYLESQCND